MCPFICVEWGGKHFHGFSKNSEDKRVCLYKLHQLSNNIVHGVYLYFSSLRMKTVTFLTLLFICVSFWPYTLTSISTSHTWLLPMEGRRGHWMPWNGVTGGCEPPCGAGREPGNSARTLSALTSELCLCPLLTFLFHLFVLFYCQILSSPPNLLLLICDPGIQWPVS